LCEALEDRRLLSGAVPGISATGQALTLTEGAAAAPVVATFTRTDTDTPSWSVTINWGDGTPKTPDTSAGTVTGPDSSGKYTVTASSPHTYVEEGFYPLGISIKDTTNKDLAYAAGTATVADAPLHITVQAVTAVAGQSVSNVTVATFTDDDPGGTLSDYTATVDWGDGTPSTTDTSTGTIAGPDSSGTYTITASKPAPYADEGSPTIKVTVQDGGVGVTGAGTWTTVAPLPTARSNLAAAVGPDGLIYAIGGIAGNAVYVYNPATNSWTTVASLPTGRADLAAAVGPDGLIYAIGGIDASNHHSSEVDAYNPATNSWTTVASLPVARTGLAAAVGPDGLIYAIGGQDTSGISSEVDAYNPATNSWTTVASLPTARGYLAAAVAPNGHIYAIGGQDTSGISSEVDAYNPATNSWTTVAPLPNARNGPVAAVGPDGSIYAIGGIGTFIHYSSEVDAYNPATNSWTTVASLPTGGVALAAAEGHDGRIYVIGGYRSGPPSSEVDAYTVLGPSTATGTHGATVTYPPLTDTTAAQIYTAVAGQSTGTQVLATFNDPNPSAAVSDFTPTVNWGGTLVGTPSVSVQQVSPSTSGGSSWEVVGSAVYAAAGTDTVAVTVHDADGRSVSTSSPNEVQFNITRVIPSVSLTTRTHPYDAAAYDDATYTVLNSDTDVSADGTTTIHYYDTSAAAAAGTATDSNTTAPTNAGTYYAVAFFVPGSTNYQNSSSAVESFTITKVHLTVTANSLTKLLGAPNPTLTFKLSGFVGTDTASVVSGSPTLYTEAGTNTPVGKYTITVVDAGNLSATNYDFPSADFVNGTLTIGYPPPKVLSPTAGSSKKGGSTLPITLQILNVDGSNVGSSSLQVKALGISTSATYNPSTVMAATAPGNSQPGGLFKFSSGTYQFNLKLVDPTGKDLTPGLWYFYYQVGIDPTVFSIAFTVT
jgi:N-acetylneuraminic acid mutarotase